MSVAVAFLRRDIAIFTSYRLNVVSQFGSILFMVAVVYFLGETVQSDPDLLDRYGGDYVAFLLAGFALADLFTRGVNALPAVLRDNQQSGTLEPMLATPMRLWEFTIASSLFPFLQSVARTATAIAFGAIVMGLWHDANIVAFAAVVVPAIVALFALGLFFAACVIYLKQAAPLIQLYVASAAILGGMLFPIEALPAGIRIFAWLLPTSHALTGARLALAGHSLADVAPYAIALTAIAVLLLPVSSYAFSRAMYEAKKEGSLAQY